MKIRAILIAGLIAGNASAVAQTLPSVDLGSNAAGGAASTLSGNQNGRKRLGIGRWRGRRYRRPGFAQRERRHRRSSGGSHARSRQLRVGRGTGQRFPEQWQAKRRCQRRRLSFSGVPNSGASAGAASYNRPRQRSIQPDGHGCQCRRGRFCGKQCHQPVAPFQLRILPKLAPTDFTELVGDFFRLQPDGPVLLFCSELASPTGFEPVLPP